MGWLLTAAVRATLNQRDAHRCEEGLDSAMERNWMARAVDPELVLVKDQLRTHFRRALGEAFDSLSAEERNLIRLHWVEGLRTDRLAAMLQIHRSTAARRIGRIQELLLERTRDRLAERTGLPGSELDSALRLIRSELDVKLSLPTA